MYTRASLAQVRSRRFLEFLSAFARRRLQKGVTGKTAMGNAELLEQYRSRGDERAFGQLVERYIHFVYSAARRQVRDAHLAEDITQAVFIIFSQKARSLRNPAALGGWLLQTTHHVACNALRLERRRARHEQEAAAMTPTMVEPGEESLSRRVSCVLDDALARLREGDRSAIVLRFLEGKSVVDVGSAMGISEAAAQKRIVRALSRLRDLFARRGIVTAADALPETIAGQALLSAPLGLIAMVSTTSTAIQAGTVATFLAKATVKAVFWTNVKAATIGLAATVAITVGVAVVASSGPTPSGATPATPATPAAAAAPVSPATTSTQPASNSTVQIFPNAVLVGPSTETFLVGVDPDTRRTPASDPAAYIKSSAPATKQVSQGYGASMEGLRGKRVRLSAWIKTRNVANWSDIEMSVLGYGQRVLGECELYDHPITGTTDWQQCAVVADVPADAQSIVFTSNVYGKGEMWTDGFRIETVREDVPTTDDQKWHAWSPMLGQCSAALDPTTLRNGHPTMRVTCNAKSWVAYDHANRHVEQYLGKRVRVSAWLKAEHVSVVSGLWIRAMGPNYKKIIDEGNWGKWETAGAKPLKGTVGWTHFVCELDVPLDTQYIVSGMIHNGTGTMWMDDFKFEVLDAAPGGAAR
jgi:RNA polymerase sigma factor (sigma-70 family)